MRRSAILSVILVLVCGCATPYQSSGWSGGYSDTRLREDVFSVRFRGNGHTSAERCSDFALLRCAELSLENGYACFAIVDSAESVSTIYVSSGGTSETSGTLSTYGNTTSGSFTTRQSPTTTVPVQKPRSSYTILCLKEKPQGGALTFDAEYLANSIRQKYGMSGPPME